MGRTDWHVVVWVGSEKAGERGGEGIGILGALCEDDLVGGEMVGMCHFVFRG